MQQPASGLARHRARGFSVLGSGPTPSSWSARDTDRPIRSDPTADTANQIVRRQLGDARDGGRRGVSRPKAGAFRQDGTAGLHWAGGRVPLCALCMAPFSVRRGEHWSVCLNRLNEMTGRGLSGRRSADASAAVGRSWGLLPHGSRWQQSRPSCGRQILGARRLWVPFVEVLDGRYC